MFCTYKWVMVKQERLEEVTPGGIVLPNKVRDKHAPARGVVVEAGVGCQYVRKGDRILFDKDGAFTDSIQDVDGKEITHVFVQEEKVCIVTDRNYEAVDYTQRHGVINGVSNSVEANH